MRLSTVPALAAAAMAGVLLSTVLAAAGEFDGTWKGKWGGSASAQIRVAKDKVTFYSYNGQPQNVGGTSISGKTLTFGSDFKIRLTMTGKNTANATYRGPFGTAAASLKRG